MVESIHIAIVVISVLITVILLRYGEKYMSPAYVLMVVIINISNLGYMELRSAQTLEAAILANKIAYIGGCFLPFFILECICKICKKKMPIWVKIIALILNSIVYALVCTTGHSTIYYKEVFMFIKDGITYMQKVYGPGHKLYLMLLGSYYIAAYWVVIRAFFRRNEVSYKACMMLFGMIFFSTIMYVLGGILGIKDQCIPFIYLVDGICLLILLSRIKIFDVSTLISTSIDENNEYGYVAFDCRRNYIGCNKKAISLFDKLSQLKVDGKEWYEMSEPLFEIVKQDMDCLDRNEPVVSSQIHSGDLEIRCTVKHILNQYTKRVVGYYVYLFDDTEQIKYVELLNNYNEQLEKDVQEKVASIQKIQDDIIVGMADIVENRDRNTGGHVRRTSKVVAIIVQKMMTYEKYQTLHKSFFNCVVKAAPLHDFGKIAIEDSILRKTGRFTAEEFEKMKEHSDKGAKIVSQLLQNVDDSEFFQVAVNIAHYHHEKWNGLGYPQKLKGEEIPLEARIMALADVFDALVSKRCYKNQYSYEEAFAIIKESLGTHFDPTIGTIFLECRNELEALYSQFSLV